MGAKSVFDATAGNFLKATDGPLRAPPPVKGRYFKARILFGSLRVWGEVVGTRRLFSLGFTDVPERIRKEGFNIVVEFFRL